MKRFFAALFVLTLSTWNMTLADPTLKIYDSIVNFRHFAYELNDDKTLRSWDPSRTVTDKFWVKVMENEFLKVTLLPDYGGRILSVVYKPTGHELLYQNPVGTVFGWKQNNFYYNYLVIYGGIFPTYPESEHGKTWCLPWEAKVLETEEDRISCEMRFTDSIDSNKNVPLQFRNGKTWITCIVTVTLRKGCSALEMNVKLANNRPEYLNYEYWTCMTVAPGSEPGKTAATGNTEIKVPTDLMILRSDWWPWMETGNQGKLQFDNIYTYNLLSWFSNWQDMGIGYAYPYVTNNWYGVLNHSNNIGIFRVTRRTNDTPGLKVWTWGYEQSVKADPMNSSESRRPYIELWAGTSTEFHTPAKMPPLQKKTWSEFYLPTSGLTNVNFANENAAVFLYARKNSDGKTTDFRAEVFSMFPGSKLTADMSLTAGKRSRRILQTEFQGDPVKPNVLSVSLPRKNLGKGRMDIRLVLSSQNGEKLAETSVPYEN